MVKSLSSVKYWLNLVASMWRNNIRRTFFLLFLEILNQFIHATEIIDDFFDRKTHTDTYNQIIWFWILTRPNSKKMSQTQMPFLTRRLCKRIVDIAAVLAEHKFNLCLSPSSRFNHDDTRPPWGRRGLKVGNTSSVSQACRKRRLNGAVCRNHRIKRVVPCRCRTGTLKNPTKCLWRWEPDRRYKFFFSPPAHRSVASHIWLEYRCMWRKTPKNSNSTTFGLVATFDDTAVASLKFRQIPFSGSKMWKVTTTDGRRTTPSSQVDWKEVKQKLHDILRIDAEIFLNKQVKIKNLKNNASPKNKICSNISYFMQVRMKLCQSKQVDLLFSESLLRILTLKSAALTSIPFCPHFYLPFFLSNYSWGRRFGPPPPPWKIFFIRACYAFCIKAGRNYDKRTNRRTFDPINRCPDVPFRPGLKQWDRRYIAFVADTALSNNLTLNSGKIEQRILDHDKLLLTKINKMTLHAQGLMILWSWSWPLFQLYIIIGRKLPFWSII